MRTCTFSLQTKVPQPKTIVLSQHIEAKWTPVPLFHYLRTYLLAYLGKMPANFVPHFLMIQASSELTRPWTCLVYPWKELPAGFYRLNVAMTRDRIFSLKSALFFARR